MNFSSIAVFIDAENCPHTLADEAIEAVAQLGTLGKIFAYGDFSNPSLRYYRAVVQRRNITAVQIFSRTNGKNSADIAIAMDAVELAGLGRHDAFAIVSSDSDFNRLAQKLRDSGLYVIGVAKDTANSGAYDKMLVVNKGEKALNPSKTQMPSRKTSKNLVQKAVNLSSQTEQKSALKSLAKKALKWLNLGDSDKAQDDQNLKTDVKKNKSKSRVKILDNDQKLEANLPKQKRTKKQSDANLPNEQNLKSKPDVHTILHEFWLANRHISPDGFIHCSLFGSALRDGSIKISLKELGFTRLGKLFDALEEQGFIEQKMDGSAPKFRIKEA